MAALVELWDGSLLGQEQTVSSSRKICTLRLGVLFFDGIKFCSLRNNLAGPPEQGDQDNVSLRLIAGRYLRMVFDEQSDAESMRKGCLDLWNKAVKARNPSFAANLARLLATTSESYTSTGSTGALPTAQGNDAESTRGRSRSPPVCQVKTLLRRLTSIDVEGKYRWQRSRDLEDQRIKLEQEQQQQLLLEHKMRPQMTREQFRASLQKEVEISRKLQLTREEEEKQRMCFERLKLEEGLLLRDIASVDIHRGDEPVASEAAATCIICCRSQRCVVFMPCKHFACCAGCSQRAERCPICRQDVQFSFRVLVA